MNTYKPDERSISIFKELLNHVEEEEKGNKERRVSKMLENYSTIETLVCIKNNYLHKNPKYDRCDENSKVIKIDIRRYILREIMSLLLHGKIYPYDPELMFIISAMEEQYKEDPEVSSKLIKILNDIKKLRELREEIFPLEGEIKGDIRMFEVDEEEEKKMNTNQSDKKWKLH